MIRPIQHIPKSRGLYGVCSVFMNKINTIHMSLKFKKELLQKKNYSINITMNKMN